jgi:hypothetical protein
LTIHLATLHIPRRHLRKRKSWTIIGRFYVPLEFKPKMKNWIYHHYWIPTLHKCPFKQRYIAGFAKCSTKHLSKLLTCIVSAVKIGLHGYCDTSYSSGCVNQMLILKNSKDLLEYIQSRSLSACNSIKTFDFSTLYTTIPHSKLNDKSRECFIIKNGQQIPCARKEQILFCKNTDIINMLEFLIDNIFFIFGGRVLTDSQWVWVWVQTVLLFSPTCSIIHMRQTSYRGFSRNMKRS